MYIGFLLLFAPIHDIFCSGNDARIPAAPRLEIPICRSALGAKVAQRQIFEKSELDHRTEMGNPKPPFGSVFESLLESVFETGFGNDVETGY